MIPNSQNSIVKLKKLTFSCAFIAVCILCYNAISILGLNLERGNGLRKVKSMTSIKRSNQVQERNKDKNKESKSGCLHLQLTLNNIIFQSVELTLSTRI